MILSTKVTVIDCPKTGYDEDLDDSCLCCDHFIGFDGEDVKCSYEEDE